MQINPGIVLGVILDSKKVNYGGCLVYIGIPLIGFFLALNTLAWNLDAETPHLPWLGPILIMGCSIFVTIMIAWIMKVNRDTKKKEEAERYKRFLESFQGKKYQ
jgi:hypothetical protein